jgi:hypothetical protein
LLFFEFLCWFGHSHANLLFFNLFGFFGLFYA